MPETVVAPQIIDEPTVTAIAAEYADLVVAELPTWVRSDADPIMKVLYAIAQREAQLRRRLNESAIKVMPSFAKGSYLDEMIKWMDEERIQKANASFSIEVVVAEPMTIPADYVLRNEAGTVSGKTLAETVFTPASIAAGPTTILCEVTDPEGALGNGLDDIETPAMPLAGIESITQVAAAVDGSDDESDEACFARFQLAWSKKTGAGPNGQYVFYAKSADPRIKAVRVLSNDPGYIDVYLLSKVGDGTADAAMIERVEQALSPESVRPMGDEVTVHSALIETRKLKGTVYLYPGVNQSVMTEVTAKAALVPAALHVFGVNVNESRLKGMCYVEGVSKMSFEIWDAMSNAWTVLTEDIELEISEEQVCYVSEITMIFGGFHE